MQRTSHTKMTRQLLRWTAFLTLTASAVHGQTTDSYTLSMSIMYLPNGGGQSEGYLKPAKKRSHYSSQTYYGHYIEKTKRKKLPKDILIEKTINQLDSLFRLTEFKFKVDNSVIQAIKVNALSKKYLNITDKDVDDFFSHKDTVVLRLTDIKKDDWLADLEKLIPNCGSGVIDGAPYSFTLNIKRTNQDTVKYAFNGNLYGGVPTCNVKNWLSVYLAHRQHKFFTTIPMDEYFDDKNLADVLMRFISWTKKK